MPPETPGWVCADCQTLPGGPGLPDAFEEPLFGPTPSELAPFFPGLEILEVAGRGGMGTIYKARQPQLDRLVALKILAPELGRDPAFAQRFSREAQALAKLNHSNIVGIFDFGQAGGYYYFLMEYVDGVTLRQLMERKEIHAEEAQRIVIETCHALQYAHEEGIVHQDIKPSNILLDKKGRVKIADFGLARLAGEKRRETVGGDPGPMVMGSPPYMAPEQVATPRKVDRRADLYALGVVFYEMLTGELPQERVVPPSLKAPVDPRLDAVVSRALARHPRRRFRDANEFRAAVEMISGHYQNRPGDVPRRAPPGKWRWLPRFALAAGGVWLAIVSYILLQEHWNEEKSVLIPAGALEAFAAGPEGVGVGRRAVVQLGLNPQQTQNLNRILRRYEREFTTLERQHTERSSDAAGHVFVTIKPFPPEMDQLMERMWADMAAVLSPTQIAEAKNLHFEKFFPHTGKQEVNVEIWQGEDGQYHYVEGREASSNAGTAAPLPPRYRSWLLRPSQKTNN
jgi:tRNA A-37 threonylcarbamoyl transferase component Bud32